MRFTFSTQIGAMLAQVFSPDGKSVAIFDATDPPEVANARAASMALLLNGGVPKQEQPEAAQVPHVRRYTIDEIADACVQAEISDGHFESLSIALLDSHRPQSAAPQPPAHDDLDAEIDAAFMRGFKAARKQAAFICAGREDITADLLQKEIEALRLPAPAAPQAGEAEPLFLLHTGQIDGSGEQDEWDTEANSWNAVEEFCRKHPGQTVGLYPAAQPMSREPLTDVQWMKKWTGFTGLRVKPGEDRDWLLGIIRFAERTLGFSRGQV